MPGAVIPEELQAQHELFAVRLSRALHRHSGAVLTEEMSGEIQIPHGQHRRADLVFLAGHLGDPDEQHLCEAAIVVELLQTASLVHDDVVDQATQRRGVTSVHRQVGEPMALLYGAGLFATAAGVAAGLGGAAAWDLAESASQLSRGQLLDVERAFDLDISPAEHLELLEAKTGALFALPAVLGGRCGSLPSETIERLTDFGRSIGIAYQLADDWSDISGSARGKPQGTDARNGLYGLGILHAVTDADDEVLREYLAVTEGELLDPTFVHERVVRSGGRRRVLELVDSTLRDANSILQEFPSSPARRGLEQFLRSVARGLDP